MENEVKVLGETNQGKEIGYKTVYNSPLLEIAFKTGGEVPKILQGRWPGRKSVVDAVNGYLANQPKKTVKKGK